MSETTNKQERRAAQERDWIERLMAAGPAGIFGEGPRLARGIIHPWCYRRARAEGADARWDDPGWRPLYRIMVATVEQWCQHHQWSARRTVKRMTLEDMLRLWYKEKWGAIRWEVRATSALPRSLREVVARTAWILEGASTCVCQRCGRTSQIRQPQPTERNPHGGWVNSWCDECHRNTAHEERERDDATRRAGGNGHAPRGSAPESRAETEVRIERYLASLRPFHGETDPWTYAEVGVACELETPVPLAIAHAHGEPALGLALLEVARGERADHIRLDRERDRVEALPGVVDMRSLET